MKFGLILISLMFGLAAHAQSNSTGTENATTAKMPGAVKHQRKDIDKEITNPMMRAETGAKSLWSVQTDFDYSGGSIKTPFSNKRPKLEPGVVVPEDANLAGGVSIKYRMTNHDNLNIGGNVAWLTPTYKGQRGEIQNPGITWSRVGKVGRFQTVFSLGATAYTSVSAQKAGDLMEPAISYELLTPIGKSGLQVGGLAEYAREIYSLKFNGVQDQLTIFPYVEYALNDTFTLRTVYGTYGGYLGWYNTSNHPFTFTHDASTQSFGLGISVTRNVYLYPNIQWVWSDMTADKTDVGFAAYINI